MSTRQQGFKRLGAIGAAAPEDRSETVALVARARREPLLGVHRHRLSREDLEDCYSQATLELLNRARRDASFSGRAHIANALEQRFLSRIHDRRRALSGRSPIEAAVASALPLDAWDGGGVEVLDPRADLERLTLARHDLGLMCRLAPRLSADQLLVLKSQLAGETDCEGFCREHKWSGEKYRKVAQRGRARLAALLAEHSRIEFTQPQKSFAVACPARAGRSDQTAGTNL